MFFHSPEEYTLKTTLNRIDALKRSYHEFKEKLIQESGYSEEEFLEKATDLSWMSKNEREFYEEMERFFSAPPPQPVKEPPASHLVPQAHWLFVR